MPPPEGWGWTLDECNVWVPVWSTLPIAAKACSELVKCKWLRAVVTDVHAEKLVGSAQRSVTVTG